MALTNNVAAAMVAVHRLHSLMLPMGMAMVNIDQNLHAPHCHIAGANVDYRIVSYQHLNLAPGYHADTVALHVLCYACDTILELMAVAVTAPVKMKQSNGLAFAYLIC